MANRVEKEERKKENDTAGMALFGRDGGLCGAGLVPGLFIVSLLSGGLELAKSSASGGCSIRLFTEKPT